ncbi:MAG: VWA domain-containing protein [bacterium]|nr:VWA domain-containing protein [bacterium]
MAFLPTVQWEHPGTLWGLALLALLASLLAYEWLLKRRLLQRWSQVPAVLSHSMLPSFRTELQGAFCLLGGFALAVLGFASPILSTVSLEPAWERVAIGLIVDVSPSMRAPADPQIPTGPSRLDILKQAVQDLFEQLPSGVRVGIIAFAGVSVPVVSEPSADHQAIIAKIRRLDSTFIINPGTNLAAAVQQGLALFVDTALDAQPDVVSLILLSDGDTSITPALQNALKRTPIPIFTLGIGSSRPAPIPAPQRIDGFLTNQAGQVLTTVVNASVLRFIAEQTGGLYYPAAQRADLSHRLQQLVDGYGQRVAQPVPRPRSARRGLFFAAFCSILLYQFQTRTGRLRQTAKRSKTLL